MTVPADPRPQPDFDPIARLYRWLEYLTLGPALQLARTHFLPQLLTSRRALVLGDGDGRFLARLLAANPTVLVESLDSSRTMLRLLAARCRPHSPRLTTRHADALTHPYAGPYDLVVTHFFLDCFTQTDLDRLIAYVTPHLTPRALWLFSDFRIPPGPLHLPARLLIRALYLAFRLLTGLRTTRLPDHVSPFTRAGLIRIAQHQTLGGLLTTELWTPSDPQADAQHL